MFSEKRGFIVSSLLTVYAFVVIAYLPLLRVNTLGQVLNLRLMVPNSKDHRQTITCLNLNI